MAKRTKGNNADETKKQRRPDGWVGVVKKGGVPLPGFYFKCFDATKGRRVQKYGGETVDAAKAAMIEFMSGRQVDVRTGLIGLPSAKTGEGGRKLSEVEEEFLKIVESRTTAEHAERVKAQLERFRKAIGDPAIARIDRNVVEDYMTKLGKRDGQKRTRDVKGKDGALEEEVYAPPMSPNTQRRHLSAIGSLFEFAADRRYVPSNPARGVKLRKVQQHEPFVFTTEQLHTLYGKLPEKIRDLCIFLGETGARLGEGLGLQWSDVTDEHSHVRFMRTKSRKTRRVKLTPRAAELLRARRAGRIPPLRGADLVFESVSKNWASKCFHDATKAAGFPRTATIHGLRHSLAVDLTMKNVPFNVTCEVLGHSTPAFTASRYARWVPDGAADQAMDTLGAARDAAATKRTRKRSA